MEIVFLGTSSMYPTKERSHPAVLIKYNGHNILFDCGEGTQRQMRILGESVMKIEAIFISHWHGDHSLGVAGILQSLTASKRKEPLYIFGPVGTKKSINCILKTYKFKPTYKIIVTESRGGLLYEEDRFKVYSMSVVHTVPTLSFYFKEDDRRKINLKYMKKIGLTKHPLLGKLQRGETIEWKGKKVTPEEGTILVKGKKVSYVVDTILFDGLIDFVKDSDILICESTFEKGLEETAKEYMHMTSVDAATLAKKSKSKKLILTHLSQRYEKNEKKILKEAKEVFKNTILAEDFLKINL